MSVYQVVAEALAECMERGPAEDGDFWGDGMAPPRPAPVRPGTPAKIAVMADRYKHGMALFHPADGPRVSDRPNWLAEQPEGLLQKSGNAA